LKKKKQKTFATPEPGFSKIPAPAYKSLFGSFSSEKERLSFSLV
jgi:hypothetical protein